MVTGILFISNADARILIDLGATHSFVANSYVTHLGRKFERLDSPIVVSTPVGGTLRIDVVYSDCKVMVQEHELLVDLLPLEMCDFDVILGMDWLAKHNAIVNFFSKTVVFRKPAGLEFCFQGERRCYHHVLSRQW